MKNKILIPALIDGRERHAVITVKRNQKTTNVYWSSENININPHWFWRFAQEMEEPNTIRKWLYNNKHRLSKVAGFGTFGYGYGGKLTRVPHEFADEFVNLIKSELERAIAVASANQTDVI